MKFKILLFFLLILFYQCSILHQKLDFKILRLSKYSDTLIVSYFSPLFGFKNVKEKISSDTLILDIKISIYQYPVYFIKLGDKIKFIKIEDKIFDLKYDISIEK